MKLGFSLPDRIEAFRRTGQDPVDDGGIQSREVRPFFADRMDPEKNASPPNWDLMKSLLNRVKVKRKDWTTYLIETGGSTSFAQARHGCLPRAISAVGSILLERRYGSETVLVLPVSNDNCTH